MDKILRNTLIAGIILISLSFAYAVVYRPIRTNYERRYCASWVDQQFQHHKIAPATFDAWFGVCAKAKGISN